MRSRAYQPADTLKVVRCAIDTRKSTEEGLQQEFNSLDAQRESGRRSSSARRR
jgi:site-specific DNA recombinase